MKNILAVVGLLLLSGCATSGNDNDPFESYNRAMWDFNRTVDVNAVRPIAETYDEYMPEPIKKGTSNFFSNIGDVGILVNNLLQFKLGDATSDLGRLVVNSTLGLAGLFDPATAMGLTKNDEDFGQTLAAWGVGEGPFIMLPFLGPSTLRDTLAIPADNYIDPVSSLRNEEVRLGLALGRILDLRVRLLPLDPQLDNALDQYIFVRDAYLQNRQFRSLDGDIPFEDDFDCDPEYEDCD